MEGVVRFGILVFLSLIAGISCITWKSCDDSSRSKVTDVQIGGCGSDPICPLHKGKNATFTVTFEMKEDASSAKAVVHGIISGVPVPFSIDNPDGCKNCGLSCPLKNGNQYKYSTSIFVKDVYPSIKLVVKWELLDENSKDMFCILVPVEITSSNKKAQIL